MTRNIEHQFSNLSDVGEKLELENPTVENVVDILVDIGHDDRVYTFHDDFLGLKAVCHKTYCRNISTSLKKAILQIDIQMKLIKYWIMQI